MKQIILKIIEVILYGEYPKGWTEKDEIEYQQWARTMPDIRARYQ